MNDLLKTIKLDHLQARKERDKDKSSVLSTLLGDVSPSGNETVTNDQVQAGVKKFAKSIREMIELQEDSTEREKLQQELEIVENYLPKQLSDSALERIITEIIDSFESDMDEKKKMGTLMKALNTKYKDQFDGKKASLIAKELL